MTKCPTCEQQCDSIKVVIRRSRLFEGCDSCLPSQVQQGNSAAFDRRYQQGEYRRELTQPNQREYAKAYPADFKKRHGDELYRQMG